MILKKKLEIPLLEFSDLYPDLISVSAAVETYGIETYISEINWREYSYQPEVTIFAGYTQNEILLKYRVNENYILARYAHINSPVYKDSCVEFFISSGNGFYYNFEFSCIGTSYAGYGKQRGNRILIDEELVSKIRTYSTLGNKTIETRETEKPWELTVAIPLILFNEEEYRVPLKHSFRANFYKCGDDLPVPHYLSWNPIDADSPDFHRPESFGEVNFI